MTIEALRLSFVFAETILDLQRGNAVSGPLDEILTQPGFINAIDGYRANNPLPLDLKLPWPNPAGQHFWERYLGGQTPRGANGAHCFQMLVPLRLPKLVAGLAAKPGGFKTDSAVGVRIEGYYHPFGTGLIVTADLRGSFDIGEAGNLAQELRYKQIYQVKWGDAEAPVLLTLNQLATEALARLCERGFGNAIFGKPTDVFSIATIIIGDDADADSPLVQDTQTHRLLNGLANWVKSWDTQPAPALVPGVTQLRVLQKTSRPGHVLLAGPHGRAVWFPALFHPATAKIHSLGCYHRNLTLASLQTESLLLLASEVNNAIVQAGATSVPAPILELGRLSGGLLARLYYRTKTYNSDSARAQIDQSPLFDDVNALRRVLAIGPPLQAVGQKSD